MDIYIKPMEKVQMVGRKIIYLSDVAEVYAGDSCQGALEKLPVFQVPENTENMYLISVLELVQAITALYPKATVSNVGESDILLSYTPYPKKENKLILWSKILFVSAVLFCGAATTIMCFHSDTQLPLIFQNYYAMAYGENTELPKLVTIPYSIGLVVGILVFFNHFSKFALSKDPTPIEVEMTTYEKETITSTIEQLGRKKREENLAGACRFRIWCSGGCWYLCIYCCHWNCAANGTKNQYKTVYSFLRRYYIAGWAVWLPYVLFGLENWLTGSSCAVTCIALRHFCWRTGYGIGRSAKCNADSYA